MSQDTDTPALTVSAVIVCIVDDDASVRKSLANLLRSAGYHARLYSGGEDFLAQEHFEDIACLLLDLKMHGFSGIEVMQALASRDRKFPVICMSAHWDDAALAETRRYNAFACLGKPFSGDVLLRAVESALENDS
jgi:FixJ family two-component response regulator